MFINIKGAKENNLKNIDVQIPKNKLIVFTGLSGSGKSTLVLETLQRECQRQYMESMGLTMDIGGKPKVDSIEGCRPRSQLTSTIQTAIRVPRWVLLPRFPPISVYCTPSWVKDPARVAER